MTGEQTSDTQSDAERLQAIVETSRATEKGRVIDLRIYLYPNGSGHVVAPGIGGQGIWSRTHLRLMRWVCDILDATARKVT